MYDRVMKYRWPRGLWVTCLLENEEEKRRTGVSIEEGLP